MLKHLIKKSKLIFNKFMSDTSLIDKIKITHY